MGIIDAVRQLNSAVSHKEIRKIAVEIGMEILDCERGCIFIVNQQGGISLKYGLPENEHGLGATHGTDHLWKIIESGKTVDVIQNACDSPRASYMSEHAEKFRIKESARFPILYKGEALGILVFDKTDDSKFSKTTISYMKEIAGDVGIALKREYQKREEIENQIKNANLAILGQNSASTAHSLKNPLVPIGGFTRMILKKLSQLPELEKEKEYCEIIIKEVERMERVIREVMGFTTITSKKLNLTPCNIHNLLIETASSFLRYCHSGNLKVRAKFAFEPRLTRTNVFLDGNMMRFCFEDLLRNAIEARASIVKIKTKIQSHKNMLRITFANNGEPIDRAIVDKIFSPFMTRKADGTGLGLANARAIIEAHDGKIWAEGKNEESAKFRTKFKLEIPLRKL